MNKPIKYLGLGGACAGVRTRGGLNSSRFVGGRLTSSVKQFLGDIRHYMNIHCRCSKETYLDENTLLNYRWQSSADQLPKSVSNFIKKAPIKEVTKLFIKVHPAKYMVFLILMRNKKLLVGFCTWLPTLCCINVEITDTN